MNRRHPHPQHDTQHTPPSHKKDSIAPHPQSLVQRAVGQGIQGLRPADIQQLQKTLGNAAVAQLAQNTLNAPASVAPIQRVETKAAEGLVLHQFGVDGAAAAWIFWYSG